MHDDTPRWFERGLNGYTAGFGVALGLIAGAWLAFGVLNLHPAPRALVCWLGGVGGVLLAAGIAAPFSKERGNPTLP